MSEEKRDQPPDEPQRPEPPEDRPIEDLPTPMGTGAFAIPIPDVEPEDKPSPPPPAASQPPAERQPPAASQPPPPPEPERPPPPPERPIEDLGPVMGTGAFAIPVPDQTESGPPSQPRPPAVEGLPGADDRGASGLESQPASAFGPPPSDRPGGAFDVPPSGAPSAPQPPQGGGFGPPPPGQGGFSPPAGAGGLSSGDPLGGSPGYAPPPAPGYGGGQAPPGAFASPPPAGVAMGQFTLAGWGSRVGATLLDGLIVVLAVIVAAGIPGVLGAVLVSSDSGAAIALGVLLIIVAVVIYFAVALFYAPYWLRKTNGQTIGKSVVNIRVVRTDGQPITFGFACLRELAIKTLLINGLGSLLLYIPPLLNALWPLWDEENRAWHDMLANTRVVDSK